MSGSAPEGAAYRSLTGRTAFARIYKTGTRTQSGGVVIRAASGEPGLATVGVVAGKRVGGAVARNRAKRRLRGALRQVRLEADTAYIVAAEASVVEAGFGHLVGWLEKALARQAALVSRTAQREAGAVQGKESTGDE